MGHSNYTKTVRPQKSFSIRFFQSMNFEGFQKCFFIGQKDTVVLFFKEGCTVVYNSCGFIGNVLIKRFNAKHAKGRNSGDFERILIWN